MENCHDEFRISEYDSAKEIHLTLQSITKTKFAFELRDDEGRPVKSVIFADLCCHNLCHQYYMHNCERDITPEALEKLAITIIKHFVQTRYHIIDKLLARECCTMNDIVEFAMSLLEEGEMLKSTFQNRDMKQVIMSHKGESVTIYPNSRVNEPNIFIASDMKDAGLSIKLKKQDIMRDAAIKLREFLIDVAFGMQDSFLDSTVRFWPI